MRVKISWDEGSTFERECDLAECFPDCDDFNDHEYLMAKQELKHTGRYWVGGGAAPLCLLMLVR